MTFLTESFTKGKHPLALILARQPTFQKRNQTEKSLNLVSLSVRMDYLKKGWNTAFNSIKKKKRLFLAIVILQLIFVVSSLGLGSQYLLKILQDTQGIIDPLENANYDSQKIEQGEPFTPDYTSIYNSYRSMLKNVFSFLAWMVLLFLLLNGSIWLLSHWMLQEKKPWKVKMREGWQFLLKAWAAMLFMLAPFKIVSYYILLYFIRISESFSKITVVLKVLLIASLAVYYFLLVALAVAPLLSWKKFVLRWASISVKQFQKTALLFVVIMATLLFPFGALYFGTEYSESVLLLLLLGLLSLITLVVSRIFWIASVQEIENASTK